MVTVGGWVGDGVGEGVAVGVGEAQCAGDDACFVVDDRGSGGAGDGCVVVRFGQRHDGQADGVGGGEAVGVGGDHGEGGGFVGFAELRSGGGGVGVGPGLVVDGDGAVVGLVGDRVGEVVAVGVGEAEGCGDHAGLFVDLPGAGLSGLWCLVR
nr:hypothetical protein [Mycolicibacterium hippocampi]